jgi:hypothetical protein
MRLGLHDLGCGDECASSIAFVAQRRHEPISACRGALGILRMPLAKERVEFIARRLRIGHIALSIKAAHGTLVTIV